MELQKSSNHLSMAGEHGSQRYHATAKATAAAAAAAG
jgi:hypothetical protein